MIRHLVLFKLNDGVDRERDERVPAGAKAFEELGALVPELRAWECGWNTTQRDIAYDYAISCLVDDREALKAYADHPAHQAAAAQWREFATWVIADIEV
ncbi:Dabb family protein [Streptacidiphilus sp. ASG 303]|uniref:Dabb family protein n=1 Tax=Streptacidiphilus sp. ASG 303 TaxID=2896847 RepID=UPI001E61083C|nr:Dabb family protein [Streptacidiphilus sp. ASG 303]MCD0482364.1 Dabb family protein [Streptacidiphilus sp. ASG 303]